MDKEILGALSVGLSVIATLLYYRSLWRGETRPHLFTWVVWTLITVIALAAQISENGGAGTWVMAFTAFSCASIAVISIWRGEKNITRSDWISFIAAISAVPVWIITHNPLWSVIIVTLIDLLGTYPTLRKSWMKPWDEPAASYMLCGVKFIPSLFALEVFNWTTALYPASLVVVNCGLASMLLWRRKMPGFAKQPA